MHQANLGDRVRIQYTRVPEPSARANKASAPKTCEFTVGSSKVFRSLSLGVVGMAPGERKQLTLQPPEAYGAVQRKLIRLIPRDRFPKHLILRVGKRLAAVTADSRRRVRVVKVNPDSVLVDGNHPLAGQVIELEFMLISVDSSSNTNKERPQFDLGGRG